MVDFVLGAIASSVYFWFLTGSTIIYFIWWRLSGKSGLLITSFLLLIMAFININLRVLIKGQEDAVIIHTWNIAWILSDLLLIYLLTRKAKLHKVYLKVDQVIILLSLIAMCVNAVRFIEYTLEFKLLSPYYSPAIWAVNLGIMLTIIAPVIKGAWKFSKVGKDDVKSSDNNLHGNGNSSRISAL